MNKDYQLERLSSMLEDPANQSGLYMIDTDLSDEELESFITKIGLCRYIKEMLIPANNTFELF